MSVDIAKFSQAYQVPLLYLTICTAFSLPSGIYRICITLPITVYLVAQSVCRERFPLWGDEYSLNNWIVVLCFIYFDWICLASPDRENWHKIRKTKKGDEDSRGTDKMPQDFLARFWFAVVLQFNLRGTGWSHQPKKVPRSYPSDYPLWKFIFIKLIRATAFFFLQDQVTAYLATTPHGTFQDISPPKPLLGLDHTPQPQRFLLCWAHIVIIYASLECAVCLFHIIAVLVGCPVDECLPMFGDLKGMYTVRKAWGEVWHMMMRRQAVSVGTWLARDVCRFHKGSFGSKYTQLFAGFLVTGAIHGFASMLTQRSVIMNREFQVFMLQAVMIFVEDHVIKLGQALGFREGRGWRVVGYVYTFVWFGNSMASWQTRAIGRGMMTFRRSVDVLGLGP